MKKYLPIIPAIFIILLAAGGFFLFGNRRASQDVIVYSAPSDKTLQDYYNQSLQIRGAQAASTTVTFLAAGDIMLSRDVAVQIGQHGADYPFAGMEDVLKSVNFNFANLEGPVAPVQPVVGGSGMVFGDASSSLRALKDFNFQIINLANNHAFDQGLAGIGATKAALDGLDIAHEGTGDNLAQAWTPAVVNIEGVKICFVGASYGTNSGGNEAAQYVAEIAETDRLKAAITAAKSECDFVVATMHAGIEYSRTPNSQQTGFAHAAIDDGADMVIGAHPHWIQPMEKYDGKYIFYSLGNFIFDQDFSEDTKEGLTLKITISKNQVSNNTGAASLDDLQGERIPATLDSIELVPVIISNSQPRPATSDETKTILQKIGLSDAVLH